MLKPVTGTVCFDGEKEQGSGVFICKEDASAYASALSGVLRVLERNPDAIDQIGVVDLKALKNLAHLVKGDKFVAKLDLRNFSDCLKTR